MKPGFLLLALCIYLFPIWSAAQSCGPTVTVYNGLAVNINPIDANKDGITDYTGAVLRVSDLILKSEDLCDAKPLQFGIRRVGSGIGMPKDTMVVFNCQDLGNQEVEIWVRNADSRTNFSKTSVNVQDNTDACGDNPPPPVSTQCATDVIAPQLMVFLGLSGTLRPGGSGTPYLPVSVTPFVHKTYDNCGGPFQYRMRKAGTGVGIPKDSLVVFNCDDSGLQLVEVWAGDPSGNWTFTQSYVYVQEDLLKVCENPAAPPLVGCSPDKTPPQLLVHSGLTQGIMWQPGGLITRFDAVDFLRQGRDKCHDHMGWRITKPEQGGTTKPPKSATTSVVFDCTEVGTQLVYIWLRDGAGNWTRAAANVLVQMTAASCAPNPAPPQDESERQRGTIQWTGGKPAQAPSEAGNINAPVAPFSVWPNPATGVFTLRTQLAQDGLVRICLYDSFGRLIRVPAERQWAVAGDFQLQIAVENLPPGVYRCVLQSGQETQSVSVVLQ